MQKAPISAIILTFNEEANLERCLESVASWVQEVIVVDSGSTDGTVSIARRYGAKVVTHPFENQAQQFNWALDNVKVGGEWILRLDADERILPALRDEIIKKLPRVPADVSGLYLKRRMYFMGRWIRHGGYYPLYLLRLFRKGAGQSQPRAMDEHIVLLEGRAGKLENDFIDDNRKGLSAWIAKHNSYASREAAAILREKTGASEDARDDDEELRARAARRAAYQWLPLFIRPFLYFIYRYFFRLGFLDGAQGLIFHTLQGFWYRFLVDARMLEARLKRK
jgi:glycosyltransferase involved in cell wall biosynthesis